MTEHPFHPAEGTYYSDRAGVVREELDAAPEPALVCSLVRLTPLLEMDDLRIESRRSRS